MSISWIIKRKYHPPTIYNIIKVSNENLQKGHMSCLSMKMKFLTGFIYLKHLCNIIDGTFLSFFYFLYHFLKRKPISFKDDKPIYFTLKVLC